MESRSSDGIEFSDTQVYELLPNTDLGHNGKDAITNLGDIYKEIKARQAKLHESTNELEQICRDLKMDLERLAKAFVA